MRYAKLRWRTSQTAWRLRHTVLLAGLIGLIAGAVVAPGSLTWLHRGFPQAAATRRAAPGEVAHDTSLMTVTGPAASSSAFSSTAVGKANATTPVTAGIEPITVTVTVPTAGLFTVTVTAGAAPLTVSGSTATGTLQDVTVTDTRTDYPGWSVTGQESDFTGSRTARAVTVSGNQLGWTPTAVGLLQAGARLGSAVAPGAPGLGTTAATLAFARAGCSSGTSTLSAKLKLRIPASAKARSYSGVLTITYIDVGPSRPTGCGPA